MEKIHDSSHNAYGRSNAETRSESVTEDGLATISPPVFQLKSVESTASETEETESLPIPEATYQLAADDAGSPEENGMSSAGEDNRPNNTGLPDQLKSGVESLSGFSLDDVKVHYNSDKPAQLQAHAYAQGTDIHLGAGQEKHLPHEAWHVVQQKQGRVQATTQMKGIGVNDDHGLEQEADVMAAKAFSTMPGPEKKAVKATTSFSSKQPFQLQGIFDHVERKWYSDMDGVDGYFDNEDDVDEAEMEYLFREEDSEDVQIIPRAIYGDTGDGYDESSGEYEDRRVSVDIEELSSDDDVEFVAPEGGSIFDFTEAEEVLEEEKAVPDYRYSTGNEALVGIGRLFLRVDLVPQLNSGMSSHKVGPGASGDQGAGSFVTFVTGQEYDNGEDIYYEIIPKFTLTRDFEGESEKAQINRETAENAKKGYTESRYWTRTLAKNEEGEVDDSSDPLKSSPDNATPMAGPADCEAFSALVMGVLKKRNRRLAFQKDGEEKLLPDTDQKDKEYGSSSVYRNNHPRTVAESSINLQNSPAQALIDEMMFNTIFDFINKPENLEHLDQVHKSIPDKFRHPNTGRDIDVSQYYNLNDNGILILSEVFKGAHDLGVSKGMQVIKSLYWGLKPDLRKIFDKEHGINQYANPTVGESFMMGTQDDATDFEDVGVDNTWSMHWGAVILDLGTEKITLEGYAQQGNQELLRQEGKLGITELFQCRDAQFGMYSGIDADTGEPYDPEKTFQTVHLGTGTHGSHAITGRAITE